MALKRPACSAGGSSFSSEPPSGSRASSAHSRPAAAEMSIEPASTVERSEPSAAALAGIALDALTANFARNGITS